MAATGTTLRKRSGVFASKSRPDIRPAGTSPDSNIHAFRHS